MQYTNIIWRNGQPYSELFDDIYYSSDDKAHVSGDSEFDHVFFRGNGLPQRWQGRSDFVIAELGFGSGLNCMLTIQAWLKHCDESDEHRTLHYIAIEKYPLSADTLSQLLSTCAELKELNLAEISEPLLATYPPAVEATHCRRLFDNRVVIHFKFMDVDTALKGDQMNVDAWYLDGFAPAKNPDMWTQDVFLNIKRNSRHNASCSTYTCAGFVKRNLQNAGFEVTKVAGYGRKREMLVAHLPNTVEAVEVSLRYKEKPWFARPLPVVNPEKKISIIGAGIAGLSLAYAMVQRGYSVTIIDKSSAEHQQTSSNPAPIVYPRLSLDNDADSCFFIQAYCYARHVFQTLQKKTSQRFYFDDGLLQLMDVHRIKKIKEKFQFNDDFFCIAKEEKATLGVEEQKNAHYATAGVVLPTILLALLKNECGDKLKMIDATVDEVKHDDKQWRCFGSDGIINKTDILIVANGTRVNDLGLPLRFPIDSVRGQVLCLLENKASSVIQKTQNAAVHITPAINGKHYLGASYTKNNNSSEVNAGESMALLQSLETIYPRIFSEADICHTWLGFRAISKDRVPIAGAVPDAEFYQREYADIQHGSTVKKYLPATYLNGLYISAAHGSRGFTSSFLCAEIIAAQITGEPSPVNKKVLDYLSPSRFMVNDFKRR